MVFKTLNILLDSLIEANRQSTQILEDILKDIERNKQKKTITPDEAEYLINRVNTALDKKPKRSKEPLYRHTTEYVRDALFEMDYVLARDLIKAELVRESDKFGTFKIWFSSDPEDFTVININY